MTARKVLWSWSAAVLLTAALLPLAVRLQDRDRRAPLRCVIALDGYRSREIHYDIGYNYEMLRAFAAATGREISITTAPAGRKPAAALLRDSTDLVVLPYSDTLCRGCACSGALADGAVWAVPKRRRRLRKEIDGYLQHTDCTPEQAARLRRFTPSYHPLQRAKRGGRYLRASPYDELIRKHAGRIGWEWRKLAALIWQESNFRIEAVSRRGARGLMQVMPRTAAAFGTEDLLDPEENIRTGTGQLVRLSRFFSKYASGEELFKIVLAAYNAGEGRILGCIAYADSCGLPRATWDDITALIELRRDEERTGTAEAQFQGYETLKYVASVLEIHAALRATVPGP